MRPRRLFRLFRGREARRRELEEEIEAHLAMRADDLVRRGWSAEDAAAEARRRFGDLERARRELASTGRARDARLRARARMDVVRSDVGLALRRARRSPGFTALALGILGLGIGLTAAVFTSVDRALLRPLAFPGPDRLVSLQSMGESRQPFRQVSSENWLDWDEHNRTLAATALHQSHAPAWTGAAGPVRLRAERVSGAFFEVLRPPTVAGRVFERAEVREGAQVAVVSEPFWRGSLGARPDLPFELELGEERWRVVGVVGRSHAYPAGTQVWLPTRFEREGFGAARNRINYEAIGRLAPGVSLERAEEDLARVAQGIRESAPEALYSWGVGVIPLHKTLVADARVQLLLLLGAVAAVLVLACLNLAGLSLARALGRADEVAVRMALGAGRGRVVRQLLTEHLVLGVAGGALGLAVAAGSLGLVERTAPAAVPREAAGLDIRVLAFALVLSLASGILAGVWPALRASTGGGGRMRPGSRGGTHRSGAAGSLLVAGEVALALILLVGGGLLVRSFLAVTARDTGFDPGGVVVAHLILDRPEYRLESIAEEQGPGAEARRTFWRSLLERLSADPLVDAVAVASAVPTDDGGNGFIELEDLDAAAIGAAYVAVSHGYFEALRIPVLTGRPFGDGDRAGSARVTVVSRAMAERYWPGESALGQRVRATSMEGYLPGGAPWLTVIGVVGDVRHYALDETPPPEMYVLHEQVPYWMGAMSLVVRGRDGRTDGVGPVVRRAVGEIDASLPVEVASLEDRVADWVADRLRVTSLLAGFSALALVLAAIGLYGLLAFQVARRTREIGIRCALGAHRTRILGMVVRQSLVVTAYGLVAGLFGAWMLSRSLTALLVDVAPADPVTYVGAGGVLLATALAAATLPAWRAARVDPLISLRDR